MNIAFTYNIIKKNNGLKLMEVAYSAPEYETIVVSMPFPFTDVTMEEHIRTYAPFTIWEASKKTHQDVAVGVSGTIEPTPSPIMMHGPTVSDADVLAMIASLKTPTP